MKVMIRSFWKVSEVIGLILHFRRKIQAPCPQSPWTGVELREMRPTLDGGERDCLAHKRGSAPSGRQDFCRAPVLSWRFYEARITGKIGKGLSPRAQGSRIQGTFTNHKATGSTFSAHSQDGQISPEELEGADSGETDMNTVDQLSTTWHDNGCQESGLQMDVRESPVTVQRSNKVLQKVFLLG